MKNTIGTLKIAMSGFARLVASLIIMIVFAFISCNGDKKPEDTKVVAEEHNDAKFDNAKEDDAKFLVTAAEINLEEIQLGQLTQKNGMIKDVKDLGKMMETDHSGALKDLQALAAKKQITIPASLTDNGKDAYKKLMEKKGKDFDKAYCGMMVDGHKAAIDKFEKASTGAADPDIKAWAASMLPALRMHLDHSIACQAKCK